MKKKTVLSFDKPRRVDKPAGFEGGPDGGYVPQMSDADMAKWKAKLVNAGKPDARVEIRKTVGATQMLIIVGRDGWNYSTKHEVATRDFGDDYWSAGRPEVGTRGKNVRVSLNGPLMLSWAEFEEMQSAVAEARAALESA